MEFQCIALTVLTAFYGCYFAKMFQQKRQGIQTDQLGKGKAEFEKFVEIAMKTAAVLVAAVELGSIFLGTGRFPVPFRIAGAALSVLGTVLFIAAVLTMRDSWWAGVSKTDKTRLVTTGVYQLSRNPAFMGFDLLYAGVLLMFFNGVLCAATVLAILLYHLQIVHVEEVFLRAAFGEEYSRYRKKVCRYLGRKW